MDPEITESFLSSPHPGSLVRRLPWRITTPLTAYERVASGRYSFLLESAKVNGSTGRYSFVGTEPYLILKAKGPLLEIDRGDKLEAVPGSPITALKNLLNELSIPKVDGLPPFFAGAVGLFSYDFVRFLEKLPRNSVDDLDCPDLLLMFVDTVIAFDHKDKSLQIIYTPPQNQVLNTDRKSLFERGLLKIKRIEERLANPFRPARSKRDPIAVSPPESNLSKLQYMKMVRRCKEYIAAGDLYQANLSQRFSVPFHQDAWSLYQALRKINPAPFGGFLQLGDFQLVSASPERLVRLQSGIVETRPIAGTRPRGGTLREDEGMRSDLLSSEKERAEHLMLVDLERNDLGKVCRYGSIHVDEFMVTELYSHVMHIVSNIRGELFPGKQGLDVICSVFPGGTITGVPKVRCMEIIEELEPSVRGPYSGSFGYINLSGELDLNLIIRTFVIKNNRAYIQVGGGIVADSEPGNEYRETLYKAEALLKALEKLR